MQKVYGLYRYFFTERGNKYSPVYYLGKQFEDMARAGIISLNDDIIPEYMYTGEVAPGIKAMRRFMYCTYDDTRITETDFIGIVKNVSSMNDIVVFDTIEKAREWIRNKTDLEEVEEGKFLIAEAQEEGIEGPTEAVYLIID